MNGAQNMMTLRAGFAELLPSVSGKQPRTALDYLKARWRFCAGYSFAMMLAIAVRLVDALPGSAASTLTRSVVEIWLLIWLPASLALGVGIGLIDQKLRSPWQRGLAALVLVACLSVVYLLVELTAFDALARAFDFTPFPDQIAADRYGFILGQSSWSAINFGLLAWFYMRTQDAQRSSAALHEVQLTGLRATQAVAQDRLSAIQSQVDPDFLFAALSFVQAQYQNNPAQAQVALDEVITFLRAAMPGRQAEDRAFVEEAALAKAYLQVLRRISHCRCELNISFADSASKTAGFPPQICLPLVKAAAQIHTTDPSIRLLARVSGSRFQVTMDVPGCKRDEVATRPLLTAVKAARQALAAIHGADATLQLGSMHPHFQINIEIPYAPSAHR